MSASIINIDNSIDVGSGGVEMRYDRLFVCIVDANANTQIFDGLYAEHSEAFGETVTSVLRGMVGTEADIFTLAHPVICRIYCCIFSPNTRIVNLGIFEEKLRIAFPGLVAEAAPTISDLHLTMLLSYASLPVSRKLEDLHSNVLRCFTMRSSGRKALPLPASAAENLSGWLAWLWERRGWESA